MKNFSQSRRSNARISSATHCDFEAGRYVVSVSFKNSRLYVSKGFAHLRA